VFSTLRLSSYPAKYPNGIQPTLHQPTMQPRAGVFCPWMRPGQQPGGPDVEDLPLMSYPHSERHRSAVTHRAGVLRCPSTKARRLFPEASHMSG
jgi:hypothetical protein